MKSKEERQLLDRRIGAEKSLNAHQCSSEWRELWLHLGRWWIDFREKLFHQARSRAGIQERRQTIADWYTNLIDAGSKSITHENEQIGPCDQRHMERLLKPFVGETELLVEVDLITISLRSHLAGACWKMERGAPVTAWSGLIPHASIAELGRLVQTTKIIIETKGERSVTVQEGDGEQTRLLRGRFVMVNPIDSSSAFVLWSDLSLSGERSLLHRNLLESVEASADGIAVTDPEGSFIYMNRAHLRLFGFTDMAEIIGKSWRILYSEEEAMRLAEVALPALAERKMWQGTAVARMIDGGSFNEELTLTVTDHGNIICNCRDKTKELKAQEKVERSERLLKDFVVNLPVGVIFRDPHGAVTFVNPAAAAFVGTQSPFKFSQTVASLLPELIRERLAQSDIEVNAGGVTRFDIELHHAGSPIILDVIKFRIGGGELNDISRICSVISDVTAQRVMDRELRETLERQSELIRIQREFVSMVSHEFRTPLCAIQGASHLLGIQLDRTVMDVRKVRRYLEIQNLSINSLRELVDQVLEINRLEHGTGEVQLQVEDLAGVVEGLARVFNESGETPRIKLELPQERPVLVELAPDLTRTAVSNLLSNALKYSPRDAQVKLLIRVDGSEAVVDVVDQGRGIPADDQNRMFTMFYRASNVIGVPGTGLGLATVKRSMEFQNGRVSFTSEVGRGSTFRLHYPLAK